MEAKRALNLANAVRVTRLMKHQLSEATGTGRGDLHNALTQRVFDCQRLRTTLFIGLDVSSRCTGIAVVDASGKGVASHACETHNYRDVIDVGQRIRTDVDDLFSEVEASVSPKAKWYAGVEACAKSFTRGRFNTKGLVKLAQINGIAQFICAERIGSVPLVVNPSTARSFYDLGLPQPTTMDAVDVEDQPVKERVFDFVRNRDIGTSWIPDPTSRSRLDVSDAFLIAWYTRVHNIFQTLAEDQKLWEQFELDLGKLKPAASRRDAVHVFHKYLWEWMREHKHFLRL